MSYEIMPPLAFMPMSVGSVVSSPSVSQMRVALGVPQRSQVNPSMVHMPLMRGERITQSFQVLTHGIPGTTTQDGFFPEDTKPQHRLSMSIPATPLEYVVALYHGEPGVLRGDDNWSQENPSIQPQLRTNTIPHTEDPVLVNGTWRVNEAFLPQ